MMDFRFRTEDFVKAAEIISTATDLNKNDIKQAEAYLLNFNKSMDSWGLIPKILESD
eukprot:CAMPEP_0114594154 /NCGR_PEP_ID=MMETSP0125-20121206/15779_1 /TAXON_ID=485358 ORGANISM="Aristerostoma sp., Strain ATCC 50986" /NCGR_SAMPLE_ID=MMETSP0125 /ASSEMBLY_ACC=CAM_ASM_000245 /LENGTH=56 /DNA_ID=CAMNT_0001794111 /DNA_START=13 /DNA_END=183 /DNA_ORIENTATION=-